MLKYLQVGPPMVMCQTPHNLHTLQSSPPALAPPIPSRTFPPTLSLLLLFLLLYANLTLAPSLLPTASPRGTFAPGGCFLHIPHTSSFLPFLHAAPLPSLAMPLYVDSPIGHVLPPCIPNTLLAVLFPYKGVLHFLLPSSYTLCLVGAQIYCPLLLTSSFSLPISLSVCSGGPSGQTTHICDTCGCSSFLSSSQCMPGYRAL